MAASLSLIIIAGLFADYLFRKMKLPGLVGMLIIGVISGPYLLDLIHEEMMAVSGDFRKIAFIVILLRAGFELHKDTLHRVGKTAVSMSMVPAVFEIIGVVLITPFLLPLGYLEAAILGCILAAVSPAVVVPLMIEFMDRGLGGKKGIPTLILAASSIDDVFVIVLFSVFLSMHGGEVHLLAKFSQIPVSVFTGILIGCICGYILYLLFNRFDLNPPKRTLVVMGTAILITWLEDILKPFIPVASLLGVMAIGFVILEKSEPIAHIISQKLKKLWVFAELLLFVLVGAQVNIQVAWEAGIAGGIIIMTGLVFRSAGTYLSLTGSGLSRAEKLFSVVAYIPKATVQAAIAAVPLSYGVPGGEIILAVSVLSIVITAPVGAVGIRILGDRLLEPSEKPLYRFRELREQKELPRVGERIRNREKGAVWKVIEERELWIEPDTPSADPKTPSCIPAIILRYWKEYPNAAPGTGITREETYTPETGNFSGKWEVLYDW